MPLPDNRVIFYLKFGEQRWLKKIANGELSFSCTEAFIEQAKTTGNNEQGDKYEAVFARVHRSDPIRFEMQKLLKDDLEEVEDENNNEFLFLRRKSAKLIPIFCTYALTVSEVNHNSDVANTGRYNVNHQPDDRMYSGFSQGSIWNVLSTEYCPTLLLIKSSTLIEKIWQAALRDSLIPLNRVIEYRDMTKEFFIPPTWDYPELFVKSKQYSHQLEYRWCILNKRLNNYRERYNLKIGNFVDKKETVMMNSEYGVMFGFSAQFNNNGIIDDF